MVSTPQTALIIRDGNTIERARAWTTMPDDERRRLATVAARDHDAPALQGLADAWLTLHGKAGATVSLHTRRNYRHGIGTLLAVWSQENVLRPRRNAGVLWLREMEDAGLKPSTIQVRLAAARALYAALRWAGATEADPFRDARPAKDQVPAWEKRGPYSPDELRALLDALDATATTAGPAARAMAHYDRVLVLLGAHAGLRASEMMALRWHDIDLGRRRLVVMAGKGGKRRAVVISSSLAAAIDAIPAEQRGEYVLPYRTRKSAWMRLKRLLERAGVKPPGKQEGGDHYGLHRLRHAAGTRLMKETGNLQEVAELLGHAQLDTARVYAAWANDTQRKTVGQW